MGRGVGSRPLSSVLGFGFNFWGFGCVPFSSQREVERLHSNYSYSPSPKPRRDFEVVLGLKALSLTIALLETAMIEQSAEVQETISQIKRQLLVGGSTKGTTHQWISISNCHLRTPTEATFLRDMTTAC